MRPAKAPRLVIALLAAGQSRRFDGVKLAASLSRSSLPGGSDSSRHLGHGAEQGGQPLLLDRWQRLQGLAQEFALQGLELEPVVILGGHLQTLSALLPPETEIVFNPNWQQGLSTSIGAALLHARHQGADGLMITLADQVALNSRDYGELIDRWLLERKTVCAYYNHRPGVPAIFNPQSFDELDALSGDTGAKSILDGLQGRGQLIMLEQARAAIDIDSRTDLHSWNLAKTGAIRGASIKP